MTNVKPLEWCNGHPGTFMLVAESVLGLYMAWEINGTGVWSLGSLPGKLVDGGIEAAKDAAFADYSARIMSAIKPAGLGVETVRHKKRGTTYEVIGVGKMQAESWTEEILGADEDGRNAWVNQSIDMREVTIYRSTDDGQIWVRPVQEFNDGRFERAALKGDEQ